MAEEVPFVFAIPAPFVKEEEDGMAGLLRVQGHSDTTCPVLPPLDESLAAHLLPQAAGWADGRP